MERELLRTDAEICRDVKDSLHGDVRVDDRMVKVDVRDGVAHLHGSVPSAAQRGVAEHIVSRTKGISGVRNELAVLPQAERDDVDITADVAAALSIESRLDAGKIDVTTLDGVVHLRGSVSCCKERKAAEAIARSIAGVADVIDEMMVVPILDHLADEDVAHSVWLELESNLRLPPGTIDVEVTHGIARLCGKVQTPMQRLLADEIARWTPGVVDVVNELTSVC